MPTPDTFRVTPDVTLQFMRDNGICLLIDSFHDDAEWCVALNDPSRQAAA